MSVARVTIYNRIDGDAAHASLVSSRLSNSVVSLRDSQGYTLKLYEIGDATGITVFNISFDSYLGQTPGPTQSPTVFTPCTGMTVEIKVTTDNFPNEIAWTLVNKCGTNFTRSSPPYSLPNKMESTTACVPSGKYTFAITDEFGDGICCSFGLGRYEILVDGVTVHTGAHGGSLEEKTFGACPTVDSYLGCYIDLIDSNGENGEPYFAGQLDINGKTNCIQACFSVGYQYAGTRNAMECWCGDSYDSNGVDANGCNMLCTGNAAEICGGPEHSSVYDIKVTLVHKVRVMLEGHNHLQMREVQVFDMDNVNRALNKIAAQSSTAIDCGAHYLASNAVNGNLTDISQTHFETGTYYLTLIIRCDFFSF